MTTASGPASPQGPHESQGPQSSQQPGEPPCNGIPAGQLTGLRWLATTSTGSGVEMARLPGGGVAVRNASDPEGPALIYTKAEIEALIGGAADGDFDDLLA